MAGGVTLFAGIALGFGLGLLLAITLPHRCDHESRCYTLVYNRPRAARAPCSAADDLAAACDGLFVPADAACPRLLAADYAVREGFGHQFMQGLFAMAAAKTLGLSYVYRPINESLGHRESYAAINQLLGIAPALESLGAASWGAAGALEQAPFKTFDDIRPRLRPGQCGLLAVAGPMTYCSATNNCFLAAENAGLFQRLGPCLQAAARAHGTLWRECAFGGDATPGGGVVNGGAAGAGAGNAGERAPLARVAMHIRAGGYVAHAPKDTFFPTVLRAVRQITQGYRVRLSVIGGVRGSNRAPDEFVAAVRAASTAAWAAAGARERVEVVAPTLSTPDALRAMAQSDLLIGSGSSLPQVAALVSAKPLFLHHVPKHGFTGIEIMGDHVDLDKSGKLLDSLRRVKVEFRRRMEAQRPWDPCRAAGGAGGGR